MLPPLPPKTGGDFEQVPYYRVAARAIKMKIEWMGGEWPALGDEEPPALEPLQATDRTSRVKVAAKLLGVSAIANSGDIQVRDGFHMTPRHDLHSGVGGLGPWWLFLGSAISSPQI